MRFFKGFFHFLHYFSEKMQVMHFKNRVLQKLQEVKNVKVEYPFLSRLQNTIEYCIRRKNNGDEILDIYKVFY